MINMWHCNQFAKSSSFYPQPNLLLEQLQKQVHLNASFQPCLAIPLRRYLCHSQSLVWHGMYPIDVPMGIDMYCMFAMLKVFHRLKTSSSIPFMVGFLEYIESKAGENAYLFTSESLNQHPGVAANHQVWVGIIICFCSRSQTPGGKD